MYIIPSHISFRKISDEIFILDRRNNSVFCLNSTGAHIWEEIQKKKTLEQIALELANDFEIAQEEVLKDVRELIRLLIEKHLLDEKVGNDGKNQPNS